MIRALVDDNFPYKFIDGTVTYTLCNRSPHAHTFSQVLALLRLVSKFDILFVCRKYGKYLGWIWPYLSARLPKLVAYEFIYGMEMGWARRQVSYITWWKSLRGFDRVFVQARSDIEVYSKFFKVSSNKFACIPFFAPVSSNSYIGPTEGGYVFSGGRTGRDYLTLIQALNKLNVPSVIVGSSGDDALESSLKNKVTLYRDISKERYLDLLRGAKIVVVPLDRKRIVSAGQIVALEAMALGKPLIVTDMAYMSEYVKSDWSVLVPPSDSTALSSAIKDLYYGPFERLVCMGKAGYKIAATYFSYQQFQERFEYEISRILG